jgi:hypothetical protein
VNEIELFLAAVRWAKAKTSCPEAARKVLGSTLGLFRFRLFSAEEFVEFVCPLGILSSSEVCAIFRCIEGSGNMPHGFSMEAKVRNKQSYKDKDDSKSINSDQNINAEKYSNENEFKKYPSPEIPNEIIDVGHTSCSDDSFEEILYYEIPIAKPGQIASLPYIVFQLQSTGLSSLQPANKILNLALKFSTNINAFLEGVVIRPDRNSVIKNYEENLNVIVKDHKGSTQANESFNRQVISRQLYQIFFKPPCKVVANKVYSIIVQNNIREDLILCDNIKKGSVWNGTLKLKVERDIKSQLQYIYFSEKYSLDHNFPIPNKSRLGKLKLW